MSCVLYESLGFSDALARADGTLHPYATAPAAETMQALFRPL